MVADTSLAVLLAGDKRRDPMTVEFLDAHGRPLGAVRRLDWRADGYRLAVPHGTAYVELVRAEPCPGD